MATKHTTADPAPATTALPEEAYQSEQVKGGPDPISAEVEPEVVETVQAQGIGPRDPYPTGSPPDPAETFKNIHGYDKAPDTAAEQEQKDQLDADPAT